MNLTYISTHCFLKSKTESVLCCLFLELGFSSHEKKIKREKSLSLLITIEEEFWPPIAIARWDLIFPNRIMQNYSKVAFTRQKHYMLCITTNSWAHIAQLCLVLAQCTAAGEEPCTRAYVHRYERCKERQHKKSRVLTLYVCQKSSLVYILTWAKGCFIPSI